jgi:ribonuclease VapC
MPSVVLDASAVLALLANERGADLVQRALGSALMSAVNLAEVLTKLGERGVPQAEQRTIRTSLGLDIRRFDEASAWTAAQLRNATKKYGLSMGDRACLALALDEGLPVLTADRAWLTLDLGVQIRALR